MRKMFLWAVVLGGCALSLQAAARAQDKEGLSIFGSLEEAAPFSERPILLVFFSLACHVCWDELFEMRYFLEKNGIPIDLVGVCREPEDELRQFLGKYRFFHPVVCDRQKALFKRFKVGLEPFCVILHRGNVIYEDDPSRDFFARRDEVKRWLVEIASR